MPIRTQFEAESEWLDHLRIWFAGQALAGMLANPNCGLSNGSLARRSYNIADAMLAARKGGSN